MTSNWGWIYRTRGIPGINQKGQRREDCQAKTATQVQVSTEEVQIALTVEIGRKLCLIRIHRSGQTKPSAVCTCILLHPLWNGSFNRVTSASDREIHLQFCSNSATATTIRGREGRAAGYVPSLVEKREIQIDQWTTIVPTITSAFRGLRRLFGSQVARHAIEGQLSSSANVGLILVDEVYISTLKSLELRRDATAFVHPYWYYNILAASNPEVKSQRSLTESERFVP
jgi:hypothetical protein